MKRVKITHSADDPVPVEIIASSIRSIAAGIKALRAGPLNEKTLRLLIQHASPYIGAKHMKKKISASEVGAVLDGMESLQRECLKPKKPL